MYFAIITATRINMSLGKNHMIMIKRTLLDKSEGGKKAIDHCNPKTNGPYPKWDCTPNKIKSGEKGACMPPRRQKLCVINLQYFSNESSDGLREAFIQCAAIETFWLWQKYKKDKNGGDAEEKLNSGIIPEEFKRQMFYTFGDFRDLCLGKDIGKDVDGVNDKITGVFTKIVGSSSGLKRETWWDEHKEAIWEGMLCALTNGLTEEEKKKQIKDKYSYEKLKKPNNNIPSLEDFAKKPQFLRWMIEWGEEFCREREKLEDKVNTECNGKNRSSLCVNGTHCNKACDEYKNYVETKQKEFRGQTDKFVKDANGENAHEEYSDYKSKKDGEFQQGNEYLLDKCDTGKCSCMEKGMLGVSPNEKPFGRYAHDKVKICNCTSGTYAPGPLPPDQRQKIYKCDMKKYIQENAQEIGIGGGCNPKKYNVWDCNDKHYEINDRGACMPPRRQKLCIYKLTRDKETENLDKLKMSFIKSAALETYLAWEIYKENNKDAITELQNGEIPEGFKRIMFYTFGDFRDLFFGTDMSNHRYINIVKEKVNKVFSEKIPSENKKSLSDIKYQWWQKHGHEIWEGMLCGLSHHISNIKETERQILTNSSKYSYSTIKFSGENSPTLEEFAKRPQFLRWMTEWGDDFCKQRKGKVKELDEGCNGFTCNGDNMEQNKKKCEGACAKYKKWIEIKKFNTCL
ncbi:hypothetical protein PFTANZ_06178 [Plasmodium falciparum Tanzania (2000708)]|uniref:Duffy-antigen binding domain-containing protein n=1 Tax=Plasmodium falciparum Tanzania (2000708) TaxID=1036725 RepID=A0A024VXQ2_PLAFA|nr:hypothetical protein PFTANZ_06178 [Plasmodium falciparum Tanzania (2000708)]